MKKTRSVFILMVSMVFSLCVACNDQTSISGSEGSTNEPSVSTQNSTQTPSVSTENSTQTPSVSTPSVSTENPSVTEYFDFTVVNGTGSQTHVEKGTMVTATADEPATGKVFAGWADEENAIVSDSNPYSFELTRTMTLTATYSPLICHISVHGASIFVNGENKGTNGDYEYGTMVTITADTAEPGKNFVSFMDESGNVVSREESFEYEIVRDGTILSATYQTINYTVTVVNGTGGHDHFLYNQEATVTADIIPGKVFARWEDENHETVSTQNPYTFNVTRDITLTAMFDNVVVVERPETFADVTNIVAQAALVENNLASMSFEDQPYTSTVGENKLTSLTITFYKDGLVAEGRGMYASYSDQYGMLHAYHIKDNKLFEVKDYDYNYASNEVASAKTIVSTASDSSSEITSVDAQKLVDNYGVIDKLIDILSKNFDSDSTMNVENVEGGFKITLSKIEEQMSTLTTMYGTFNLELVVESSNNFIKSFDYTHKAYVRATQLGDDGALKENATPRDVIFTRVEATKADEELENMPSSVENEHIANHFIKDFTFTGYYYNGSTRREFSMENPVVGKGASVSSFNVTITEPVDASSIKPMESTTLYFLSSSDEGVITIDDNKKGFKTIADGTSDVVVSTSAGVTKTVTFTVGLLPPASITVKCGELSDKDQAKVMIGETIELQAVVTPENDSVQTVEWSVNDDNLAEVVQEDGKVMLKGKSVGFVTVSAKSTVANEVVGTRSVYVSKGDLSEEEITNVLVGTWQCIMSSYSGTGFTFTFDAEGNLTVKDDYRGASSRFSCVATWSIDTTKTESDMKHNNVSPLGDDYYIIVVNVVEMTDSPSYVLADFHFAVAKDGSELFYHIIPGSDQAGTQANPLTKIN